MYIIDVALSALATGVKLVRRYVKRRKQNAKAANAADTGLEESV
jgi:hypothetical protein